MPIQTIAKALLGAVAALLLLFACGRNEIRNVPDSSAASPTPGVGDSEDQSAAAPAEDDSGVEEDPAPAEPVDPPTDDGTSDDADSSVDSSGPDVPPPPRTVYEGSNFYLGNAGESCDQVCTPFGGTVDATITVIGSGGTGLACVDVLTEFGRPSLLDNADATEGLGCYVAPNDSGERVRNPETSQSAQATGVRRICACLQ